LATDFALALYPVNGNLIKMTRHRAHLFSLIIIHSGKEGKKQMSVDTAWWNKENMYTAQ
jgi:hypothetical protein